ncbi:hypothetical protein SAMN05216368_10385 [Cryobacterium flavum]|uniref:PH domain-containing protein n=1 Tax=Cryobacterium flavum TaxID=1424659 RepID=A0A4R8UWI1_9MICO|nr:MULTISPECIES: hypothetical protein [Cryobacterium]TFB72510.1 hypothetical protein E3O21_19090 [Cryobacterium flavum]SDM96533.1 hypothetical protein SAMN05216368_10385 [Cryobacterium flavum]
MSESTAPTPEPLPAGWLRLDRAGWWGTFAVTPLNGIMLGIVPINLGTTTARSFDISIWWGFLMALGAIVPVFLVLYLVQRLRYPQAWVSFDRNELRAGRRVVPLADIVWARLEMFDRKRAHTRMLTLRFGAESGPRASVRLRGRTAQTLPTAVTDIVAEIIRRSSIAVPQTPNDPTGRFARYNYPGSLGRADALEVVLNPPTIDDPAPVLIA